DPSTARDSEAGWYAASLKNSMQTVFGLTVHAPEHIWIDDLLSGALLPDAGEGSSPGLREFKIRKVLAHLYQAWNLLAEFGTQAQKILALVADHARLDRTQLGDALEQLDRFGVAGLHHLEQANGFSTTDLSSDGEREFLLGEESGNAALLRRYLRSVMQMSEGLAQRSRALASEELPAFCAELTDIFAQFQKENVDQESEREVEGFPLFPIVAVLDNANWKQWNRIVQAATNEAVRTGSWLALESLMCAAVFRLAKKLGRPPAELTEEDLETPQEILGDHSLMDLAESWPMLPEYEFKPEEMRLARHLFIRLNAYLFAGDTEGIDRLIELYNRPVTTHRVFEKVLRLALSRLPADFALGLYWAFGNSGLDDDEQQIYYREGLKGALRSLAHLTRYAANFPGTHEAFSTYELPHLAEKQTRRIYFLGNFLLAYYDASLTRNTAIQMLSSVPQSSATTAPNSPHHFDMILNVVVPSINQALEALSLAQRSINQGVFLLREQEFLVEALRSFEDDLRLIFPGEEEVNANSLGNAPMSIPAPKTLVTEEGIRAVVWGLMRGITRRGSEAMWEPAARGRVSGRSWLDEPMRHFKRRAPAVNQLSAGQTILVRLAGRLHDSSRPSRVAA
ncbi:MAG: hypothetical protein HY586_01510, partial [Candidatus Omnitrophica bacterium]|nr:hypothetical protein [Candidatus Omnitrophota bacterium]